MRPILASLPFAQMGTNVSRSALDLRMRGQKLKAYLKMVISVASLMSRECQAPALSLMGRECVMGWNGIGSNMA